jgi:hypothetical protein
MPSRMMLNTGRYLWKCKDAPAEQPEYAVKLKEMKAALLKLQIEMNDPMLKQDH